MSNENINNIPIIIYKFIIGSITADEQEELNEWLAEDVKNQALLERLTNYHNLEKELRRRESVNVERPTNDMQARIDHVLRLQEEKRHTATISSLRRWFSAAAVVLLLVGVGYLSYKVGVSHIKMPVTPEIAQANTISHGQTKATLSIDNGKAVELGADQNQNISIIERLMESTEKQKEITDEPLTLSLKTPRGGEFKVTLEDGTEVWLNAESQLQYPESFDNAERRVVVSGEAYFKVAKDASRPFYVETDGQLVRVYGTEFNIHSYQEDSNVYTTLVNGKISLSPVNSNGSELVLSPGHQAVFDKQEVTSSIRSVDTSTVTSWRNGKFVFENQTLEKIMISLSRWYDFDYEFVDTKLRNTVFMGSVPRYGEFNEVLSILEKSGGLLFTQKGRTIYINQK